MTSDKIAQFDTAPLVGLDCVLVALSLENGLELSFIDTKPYLGEATKVTFEDWRRLSVTDDLGSVSSCSIVLVDPDASEYLLEVQFNDGQSLLEVRVGGEFKIQKSVARAY